MGRAREAAFGKTKTGKALRAILLAALIGAAGVAADQFPALKPFIGPMIRILTGVPAMAPAPEPKEAPPAPAPAPNQMAPGYPSKKG